MKVTISMAHVRIFRAVEGAVKNAAHGHPRWRLTEVMAQSIAKRATGTLTATWPDVLAAHSLPSKANGPGSAGRWPPLRRYDGRRGKGSVAASRRSPLPAIWKQIANLVGAAKRDGEIERAEVLIEVLRIIAAAQRRAHD